MHLSSNQHVQPYPIVEQDQLIDIKVDTTCEGNKHENNEAIDPLFSISPPIDTCFSRTSSSK